MRKLPVVAAIPNYNMGPQLAELLPQVAEQGYAEIFVLDDASTDESREVVAEFGKDIRFVSGNQNIGSGGNRNRVLPQLGRQSIIHFIDADMQLETERTAEVIQDLQPGLAGFIGGLVLTKDGHQSPFNYGPRQNLKALLTYNLQAHACADLAENPATVVQRRARYQRLLRDWPDPTREPRARRVFWALEANLIMNSELLRIVGGFDPQLREHEIQDLAIRLEQAGLARRFDPAVSTRHKEVEVRDGNRPLAMAKAELQIARKHGLRRWLALR